MPFVVNTETCPDMEEGCSKDEEVEQLMRAAKYIESALEVSLRESDRVKYSTNTVEESTDKPWPECELEDLFRRTVPPQVNQSRCA